MFVDIPQCKKMSCCLTALPACLPACSSYTMHVVVQYTLLLTFLFSFLFPIWCSWSIGLFMVPILKSGGYLLFLRILQSSISLFSLHFVKQKKKGWGNKKLGKVLAGPNCPRSSPYFNKLIEAQIDMSSDEPYRFCFNKTISIYCNNLQEKKKK